MCCQERESLAQEGELGRDSTDFSPRDGTRAWRGAKDAESAVLARVDWLNTWRRLEPISGLRPAENEG